MPTQAEYRDLMLGMLPDSYTKEAGTEVYKTANCLAAKWARLSERIETLRLETWPGTAEETIVEWERFLLLPSPSATTLAQRQLNCVAIFTRRIVPTKAQLVNLLAPVLGFSVNVVETKRASLSLAYAKYVSRIGIEFGFGNYPDAVKLRQVQTLIDRVKQSHTAYYYVEMHGFILDVSRLDYTSFSE
jgi:hypothetical protein